MLEAIVYEGFFLINELKRQLDAIKSLLKAKIIPRQIPFLQVIWLMLRFNSYFGCQFLFSITSYAYILMVNGA